MTKQIKTAVLIMAVTMISTVIAACNINPVNESSDVSRTDSPAGLLTVRDAGKRVLNLDKFMMPGESWIISADDFGSKEVDALVSISVDAVDPRVPPYQTTGDCSNIRIFIEDKQSGTFTDCRADGLFCKSVVLVNAYESPLSVNAVITGTGKTVSVSDER